MTRYFLIVPISLLVLAGQTARASWTKMETEKVLCHDAALVFTGTFRRLQEVGSFFVSYPDTNPRQNYWSDLAEFSVDKILRNKKSVTLESEEDLRKGVSVMIDGKCEGPLCHMRIPYRPGAEGIWIVRGRSEHSGSFVFYAHPEIPLAKNSISEVEKFLRDCD